MIQKSFTRNCTFTKKYLKIVLYLKLNIPGKNIVLELVMIRKMCKMLIPE